MRQAVTEHIDALEGAYGIAATAEEVRSGREDVRPMDEVAAELGFSPVELRALGRAELSDDS